MTRKIFAALAATVAVLALSACTGASKPHTDSTMLSGTHTMAPKGAPMVDKAMPQMSGECSKEALDKMPPEHRAMCGK